MGNKIEDFDKYRKIITNPEKLMRVIQALEYVQILMGEIIVTKNKAKKTAYKQELKAIIKEIKK